MPTIILNAEMSCGAAQKATSAEAALSFHAIEQTQSQRRVARAGTDTIDRAGAAAAPARSRASSPRSTA